MLAGLAFLLTIAVSRGWIGEGARTAMAAVLSLGLLGTGIWLRERRGKYEAALAAAAVGIAGSFGTLLVAGPVYHLVLPDVALLGALVIGGLATALSIRWHAQVMGWLGLLGAIWAPSVLGWGDGTEEVFLLIAYAASITVLVARRWTLLAGFVLFSATLGWAGWLADGDELLGLVLYGLLAAALAFGFEARRRGLHRVTIGPEARSAPVVVRRQRARDQRRAAGGRGLVRPRRRGLADRAWPACTSRSGWAPRAGIASRASWR